MFLRQQSNNQRLLRFDRSISIGSEFSAEESQFNLIRHGNEELRLRRPLRRRHPQRRRCCRWVSLSCRCAGAEQRRLRRSPLPRIPRRCLTCFLRCLLLELKPRPREGDSNWNFMFTFFIFLYVFGFYECRWMMWCDVIYKWKLRKKESGFIIL